MNLIDRIRYFAPDILTRATEGSSGYDLRCAREAPRVLAPGERWLAPTGLYLEMPPGVEAQVRSRSGLALNHGVIVLNAPGTIDSDYRGEVGVTLINLGSQAWTMTPGERIAQLVFCPVFAPGVGYNERPRLLSLVSIPELVRVDDRSMLSSTERGESGHGSTGR